MSYAIDSKDYKKALEYGSEILNYPVNKIEKLALEGNMAMIYYYMGELELSKEYFEKIISSSAWHSNHGICLQNYMRMLLGEGKYKEVIDLMDSHSDILDIYSEGRNHSEMLYTRAIAYSSLGDYEEAYRLLMKSHMLADSTNKVIEGDFAGLLFRDMDSLYKMKSDEAAYKKMNIHSDEAVYILLCVIIFLVAAGWFVHVRRLRMKFKPKVSVDNNSIQDEKGNIDYQNEVKVEEKDSIVRTLHHASLNETVGNISSILQDAAMNDSEKITSISSQIKEFTSYDDLWDIFHLQFEKLNPDFFSRLKGEYADLTQGEMRMCAYVLLNMSNKEIAALTRRSVRSVETMRYRLTKKMNLTSGETLSTHLHTLSQ